MYKIKIDEDEIKMKQKIVSVIEIMEIIGEEVTDCLLVSHDNIIFKSNVDISIHKKFKTVHPDFVMSYWQVVF